jgi:hypothetical protein
MGNWWMWKWILAGELSLDGAVRHTNGVLSIAMLARERGIKTLFIQFEHRLLLLKRRFRNPSLLLEQNSFAKAFTSDRIRQ